MFHFVGKPTCPFPSRQAQSLTAIGHSSPATTQTFTTLSLLNLLPSECKQNPKEKLDATDMEAFRGFWSLGVDARHAEAPPPFG